MFGADDHAGADVVPIKPALLGFQHVLDLIGRGVDGIGVVRFEFVDLQDDSIRIDVSGRKGNYGVHHPKRRLMRVGKHEEHGFVLEHVSPEHHSCLLLNGSESQLRREFFCTQPQLDRL